ncbi:helix-turn-helix domain-containing protein [Kitasatospora sp. NPDC087315]|uniref:helix-turn-helix domain-containing protein n=1 Tax=Kitasatospora sp. NPDC087315 TaxID=3364069 RepID=UPI0038189DAC
MSSADLRFANVNCEGVLADLDLLPAAYRVLLKLRAHSEPGGLINMDQAAIATLMGLSRPTVNAALRDLDLAQLLTRVRNGSYQLNPMLAGYLTVRECKAAVAKMPPEQRLNWPGFVDQYRRNVDQYQDQLEEQRRKRAEKANAEAAVEARRRGTLRAVGG